MKLKLLAHSSFLITAENGTRIITDPYTDSPMFKYNSIKETAEVVTVSHEHPDHNNAAAVKGNPQVIRGVGKWNIKGIEVRGISAFHDNNSGKMAGANTIFCFDVDGVRVCHLGDLGHIPSDTQYAEMGKVDILLTPMGDSGVAMDAATATQIMNRLNPAVTIPMHYGSARCIVPFAPVEAFTAGKNNVVVSNESEFEFVKGKLPKSEVLVPKPAL